MTPFLSIKQTAFLLGVHRKTVLRWIHDNKLPAIRIGNTYRVKQEDINNKVFSESKTTDNDNWQLSETILLMTTKEIEEK